MISEEQKSKLWFQYRCQITEILAPLRIYGQGVYVDGAIETIMELSVIAAKRYAGIDEPCTIEWAKHKASKRYQGKTRKMVMI